MRKWMLKFVLTAPLFLLLLPGQTCAQSFNATISGMITDPSGAAIPGAKLTLRALSTNTTATTAAGADGLYSFPNLVAGGFELTVQAPGFKDFVQHGIVLRINEQARLDVALQVGQAFQTVTVSSNASPLNYENAQLAEGVTPEALRDLPLLLSGNIRSAAQFAVLMPGVNTGTGNGAYDARINGGQQSGDEATLDGVTMQDSMNSQSGMTEAYTDHPMSPDSISEISVLTSNYEPQYGSTTSGVIAAVTKSGSSEFHGVAYEFARNAALNARQFGVPDRSPDIENDFGGTIGGPVKIPKLAWGGRKKTYFFASYEMFHIRGGASTPVISIPSAKERQGDFSDWVDSTGNRIPVYDPATTRANPAYNPAQAVGPTNLPYLRDQFTGCDGGQPNVICATDPRLANSLAKQWFQFLPTPTFSGPLNNYVVPVPVPNTVFADSSLLDTRVDHYLGEKDHFTATVHYHGSAGSSASRLPKPLATEQPYGVNYGFLDRASWDHTFAPTLLNNLNLGYNTENIIATCLDKPYADKVPQIAGVASHDLPPIISLGGFLQFGCTGDAKEQRPEEVMNDLLTWVRGKHTLKFGGEIRKMGYNNTGPYDESGTFNFSEGETGLSGIISGNSIASFLLGQVDSATAGFQTVTSQYPRGSQWSLYAGDTYKVTSKLSINYGIRWDVSTPATEKFDNLSFFDPVGTNPEAGRPGRLAFAGTKWGSASFGSKHPENTWFKGVAPRLGVAYALSHKTVIRSGYGIFYANAYYPGWNGGVSQDGFAANPTFSSSLGGLQAAFLLDNGFPQNFPRPPFIDASADNGSGSINYRPFDANRLPYAQQWNLTVEHQFTSNFYVNASYVGNKGTRLLSQVAPLNALDPSLLSRGQQLFDAFTPGQAALDNVSAPYANWAGESQCTAYVAQALLPYPQYCSSLFGQNENAGGSTYHSFQVKAENRFSHGIWLLAAYTSSKLLTNTDNVQTESLAWSGAHGVISPFERRRNKGLSVDDVPQILSLALTYELPVGRGKRFLDHAGVLNKAVGGWQISTIARFTAGTPLFFRSGTCNIPSQFAEGCLPAILPGADPWAQSKGSFDPSKPLLNVSAFENPNSFNFYAGQGPRMSNLRGFGYHNEDLSLVKNTKLTERVGIQFRAEFFNAWNWHVYDCTSQCEGTLAFDNDVASPSFGMWNGQVSTPRNIQFGLKLIY